MKRLRLCGVTVTVALTVLLTAMPAHATFPGKNGRIAFSLDTGNGLQINTIRPNGEGLRQITSVTVSSLDSDWSPTGTKIAFDVDTTGEGSPCRIKTMDADGSHIVDITPKVVVANGGCAYNPTFTPSGKRIVFVEQRCGSDVHCPRKIWSMGIGGKNRRVILPELGVFPPGGYDLHSPRVSPDGRTVLFTVVNETRRFGNRKALYTVRMNGTHLFQVLPYRFDVSVGGEDWAPNGQRIESSSQAGPTPVPGVPSNLFTVRPDGTDLRYLTHSHDTNVAIGAGSYSPDGYWIVYKRVSATGKYRLMKIHPSGEGATVIATLPANPSGRDWGPRPT